MHTETMAACVERLLRRLDARVGLPEVNVGEFDWCERMQQNTCTTAKRRVTTAKKIDLAKSSN